MQIQIDIHTHRDTHINKQKHTETHTYRNTHTDIQIDIHKHIQGRFTFILNSSKLIQYIQKIILDIIEDFLLLPGKARGTFRPPGPLEPC